LNIIAQSPVGSIRNAMTIDVEDYFQVQAFADVVPRNQWDSFPSRVEANTHRILDMFAAHKIAASFFTLGWVAERFPSLIKRIVADGHELASHGYNHELAYKLSDNEFFQDVARSRALLEDVGGVAVKGYRAPTFSIGERNPQAWANLERAGYQYSSSIFPVRHDLYGSPDAPRIPYRPHDGALWEIPLTTLRIQGRNLPCAGGGYFRLFPYQFYAFGLARLNRRDAQSGIFYTHPWELDPEQPHIEGARLMARFRHRVNLPKMQKRMVQLLTDFSWGRMDHVFDRLLSAGP
jgi:polysaccharide deacetylase family protein (PEP-CTERM system associated)